MLTHSITILCSYLAIQFRTGSSCTGDLIDGEVNDEGQKNLKRNGSRRHLSRY